MARAEVGDDVLGDDPTVKRLEEMAAERFGKKAAMFVPSGTMGNQCSIAAQTRPGDEILVEEGAHLFLYEGGALARIPCVQARTLKAKNGALDPNEVEGAIRPDDVHDPRTTLVALEQTHLMSGGRVVPLANFRAVAAVAKRHKMRVHCDGARIFNASVASGVPVANYAESCDSLTFCLSKGLSCPAGSLVVGDADFIGEARRVRKWMGGGMRQVGYLAACGIVALESMVERLAEDHQSARRLAEGIVGIRGLAIDPKNVETNLVFIETQRPAAEWQARLRGEGILTIALGPRLLRLVTHRHIGAREVERALLAIRKLAGS